MRRLGLVIAFLVCAVPAAAETLIVALSRPTIAVRSNFAGTQIVVFGGIERDGVTVARRGYDIVVVVRGPEDDTIVRRKDRVLGLWINRSSEKYPGLPGYYAVLSNRPLEEIASERVREELRLGAETLIEPLHAMAIPGEDGPEIVPPGRNVRPEDAGYQPPWIADASLRRRR